MEPVLTNRCVMDERTLRKTYARLFRRQLLIFYVGAGLILAFSLLLIVMQGGLSPMSAFLGIAAVVYLCIGLRMPKKQARLQVRRYEETGLTAPEVAVRFEDEALIGRREGTDTDVSIAYYDLKSVLPAGDRTILWTLAKQFVVLDTARFENGTEADFWSLMREKCLTALPRSRRS